MGNKIREIKFRAWDRKNDKMIRDVWLLPLSVLADEDYSGPEELMGDNGYRTNNYVLMQFTGLKDKNGKEIYEFMELDNKYEVDWLNGKYVLRDISNGELIDLDYENKYEITREYTKIQKN